MSSWLRACSDIAITAGGFQNLKSGVLDFDFGNGLGNIGSGWTKQDPIGGGRVLHKGGWRPISAPLTRKQPSPVTSLSKQPLRILSSWPTTSLQAPDPPGWLVQQTIVPITSNQVVERFAF